MQNTWLIPLMLARWPALSVYNLTPASLSDQMYCKFVKASSLPLHNRALHCRTFHISDKRLATSKKIVARMEASSAL
jgi:hypothetical protein